MEWLKLVVIAAVLVVAGIEARSRIYYGGLASRQYPFLFNMVTRSFYKDGSNRKVRVHCDGSMITEELGLTAGHCVFYNDLKKILFEDDIYTLHFSNNLIEMGPSRQSVKLIPHEDFERQPVILNDIALVKVDKPITPDMAQVIPLAKVVSPNGYDGDAATVVGWGLTNGDHLSKQLREGNITMTDISKCHRRHTAKKICAKAVKKEARFGQGDSGGPCFETLDDGTYLQIGIVSYYTPTDPLTNPEYDIYTDCASYNDWIQSHIK